MMQHRPSTLKTLLRVFHIVDRGHHEGQVDEVKTRESCTKMGEENVLEKFFAHFTLQLANTIGD